jgi:cytochrome subunit of sulfide dehydrogenase
VVDPRRQPRYPIPATVAGVAICWLAAAPACAAEAFLEAPPGASSCSGCHPASAAVQTPVPPLAGLPAAHVVTAMREFRSGTRPATVMDRIAKGFSDAEIAAIAAWYAGQKPGQKPGQKQ